jgi:predicted ferric reductase
MPKNLPSKRIWTGLGAVAITVLISYGLWLWAMFDAGELYDNPLKYPAKIGSHGTLILMCWAFILATRFRPIEWLFGGLDKVYKAHRYVGEAAFFLIFLHPVFLALAFSDDVAGFFRYLWFSDDWVRNTGIIALLGFILLVVLSIYVKIAYHLWKRTHDFFGLLLAIIVVHAIISGGEIMQYPILMAWHGFWVAIGLTSYVYIRVLYRFWGPQYDYLTSHVREIGDSISEVYLEPFGRPMHARPGQFVYISFDTDAVTEEPHPFSISSPPDEPEMRLSIKRLGDWTSNVVKIDDGEPARIWGPYGHFSDYLFKHPKLPAVLIGGGIGITPFLSIVRSKAFSKRSGPSTLIYSVPRKRAAVYAEELQQAIDSLEQTSLVQHFSDEEGYIDQGMLEGILQHPLKNYLFLICGPAIMMESLKSLLTEAGVKPKQIVMEDFAIR